VGPIQSLSTIAANLLLKKMCSIQHCCSCHQANASPLRPVVGHFNTPSGVLNNIRCELQLASEHIPSQAARNAHANTKWMNVETARIMEMGSESDAVRTSHLDRGSRTVRTNRSPHRSHVADGERNLPMSSTAVTLSSSSLSLSAG